MIKIKMHNKKWRIEINEEFEFPARLDMTTFLQQLLTDKERYGDLNDFKR